MNDLGLHGARSDGNGTSRIKRPLEMLAQEEVVELIERNQIQKQTEVKKQDTKLVRDRAFAVFDAWLRCAMRMADKVREQLRKGGFGLKLG